MAAGLLILWGSSWAFFAVAVSVSGDDGSLLVGLAAVASLVAVVVAAFLWPRLGGIALILGGLFAAEFFDHRVALLALAAPAVLLGVVHVLVGVMRPAARAPGS